MKTLLPALIILALFVQNSLSQTTAPESKVEPLPATYKTELFKSPSLKLRFEYPAELEIEEWMEQISVVKIWNPTYGTKQFVLSIRNETKSDDFSDSLANLIYKRLKRAKKGEVINIEGLNGWIYTREENTKIAGYATYQTSAVFDPTLFPNLDNPGYGRGMGPRYELYFYFKQGKNLWSITCGARSKEHLERYIPTLRTVINSIKFDN